MSFENELSKMGNGELEATLSANPSRIPNLRSLLGYLTATPNDINDRPENLRTQRILDKRCDTKLIKDIFDSADQYENNIPYYPAPRRNGGSLNSNSYAYGVLNNAGVTNIPNLSGVEPGADIPIPFGWEWRSGH
jgi:hypothetical protein